MMTLEEFARLLRLGSPWSSLTLWQDLSDDRRSKWITFAIHVANLTGVELKEEV